MTPGPNRVKTPLPFHLSKRLILVAVLIAWDCHSWFDLGVGLLLADFVSELRNDFAALLREVRTAITLLRELGRGK